MTSSIVHLTFVEMRRALHRRLVRWMIVLAASLSALAGVIVYPDQPRPGGAGPRAHAPGAHGVVVGRWRRGQLPAHRRPVPRRRGGDLRGIGGRGGVEGRHDHDGADLGAVAPPSARRPHGVGGDPRLHHRVRPRGRVPGGGAPRRGAQRHHRWHERRVVGRIAAGDDPRGADHLARRRAGGEHRHHRPQHRARRSSRWRRGHSSSSASSLGCARSWLDS